MDDVVRTLNGRTFVWNAKKADDNLRNHKVSFDKAMEVFFDPLLQMGDASNSRDEARESTIGLTYDLTLLYVVNLERDEHTTRIISAWPADRHQRRAYEDAD